MTTNLTVPERLRALADGKVLQYRFSGEWIRFFKDSEDSRCALFTECAEFRIKPEPEMSVPMRRYLWREKTGKAWTCHAGESDDAHVIERGEGFIRWLDPDFVSYPVEVQE